MRLHLWAEGREAIGQLEQVQVAARRLEGIEAGKVLIVLIEAADQPFGRVVGQRDERMVVSVD